MKQLKTIVYISVYKICKVVVDRVLKNINLEKAYPLMIRVVQ